MKTSEKLQEALKVKNVPFAVEKDEDGDECVRIYLEGDSQIGLFPNENDSSVFLDFQDNGFGMGFRQPDVETAVAEVEKLASERDGYKTTD